MYGAESHTMNINSRKQINAIGWPLVLDAHNQLDKYAELRCLGDR